MTPATATRAPAARKARRQPASRVESIASLFDLQPISPPNATGPAAEPTPEPEGPYKHPITRPGYGKGRAPKNKGLTYEADHFTQREIDELFAAIRVYDPKSFKLATRNRALSVLMWRSGLRVSEALAIKVHDLDAEHGTVFVRQGKGGKSARCGMDPYGFEQIGCWLKVRAELDLPGDIAFPVIEGPTRGGRMYSAYYRAWLNSVVEQTSITKRVHPHMWRHTHAVELVREGVHLAFISRQLRHSNIATTATYLASLAPQETLDIIGARPAPAEAT